jgi:hypothetical protein
LGTASQGGCRFCVYRMQPRSAQKEELEGILMELQLSQWLKDKNDAFKLRSC